MVQQTIRSFLLLSVLAEFGTAFLAATYVTFLLGTLIVVGAGIASTAIGPTLGLCVSTFLLHECARGGFFPVKDAFLNDHIPSAERATVLSCEAIAHHVGAAVGLLGSGFLAHGAFLPVAWLASGLTLVGWSFLGLRRRLLAPSSV